MSKTNPILEPLLHVLDPISLILNQNSNSNQPCPLRLSSLEDSFVMERGRNYDAYAELREKRLRLRCLMNVQDESFEIESEKLVDPSRNLVEFDGDLGYGRNGLLEKEEFFEIESEKDLVPSWKNANFEGGFGYERKGSLENDESFEIEFQKLVSCGRNGSLEKEEFFEIEPPKFAGRTKKEVMFEGDLGYGRKGSLEKEENFDMELQKLVDSAKKKVNFQGGFAYGRKGLLEQDEYFEIEAQKFATKTRKEVNFHGGFGYGRKGSLEQEENLVIEPHKFVASTRKEVRYQGGFGYGRKGSLEKEEYFEIEPQKLATKARKEVKFQGGLVSGRKGSSVVGQSVPDFSAVLRKENRKPLNYLPAVMEVMTPPSKSSFSKDNDGMMSNSRGSKSESAGEKNKKKTVGSGGVLMGRKSYACIDELRSLSSATATAINGEGRGGRNSRVLRKSVSAHRQF